MSILRRGDPPVENETTSWRGSPDLRPFLVAIADLEPFPGNPRRGDVPRLVDSLRRFGQVRPILVDGTRIVAGHHLVLAATEFGWTHIAAIANEFESEDDQRAYLLADNHLPELGDNDLELLVDQLRALDDLAGTGYEPDDADRYLAELAELAATVEPPPPPLPAEPPPTPKPDGDVEEIVLVLTRKQRKELEKWAGIVAHEKGTSGISETVLEACRIAALQLNQGG